MENSELARLPAELRVVIYEFVFSELDVIEIGLDRIGLKREDNNRDHILALAQTCQQIRKESHAIFFAQSSFRICGKQLAHPETTYRSTLQTCDRWLHVVGPENAQIIKRLEIQGPHITLGHHHPGKTKYLAALDPNERLTKSILALDNVYVRLVGSFLRGPSEIFERICEVDGENWKGISEDVALEVPLFDKDKARAELLKVFEERRAILAPHEAHNCLNAATTLRITSFLRQGSKCMMRAINHL